MRDRRGWLVLVAVLGVAGCAAPGSGIGEHGPGRVGADPSPSWSTGQAEVGAVRPGPGANSVTVQVQALAGREDCSRDVRVTNLEEEREVIFASLVQDSYWSGIVGACPTSTTVEVTITSPRPIGQRQLTINQQAWMLRDGRYNRCSENLGCDPPADRCDPTWTQAAVRGLDVSRHSTGTVEHCDGTWLVMTVPDDPAACGAEARAGCSVDTAVWRYFLRSEPAGWVVVARTGAGGCDDVLKAAPAFPRQLCAGLQPTGRYVTTAPSR
ncbi:hypothetical protein [Dactylosporangium matsuzakiense]|uniref:hypothetical protein n=1 Tax=Dactylosporangium matsuzakiense TaxID=53360 RepID=UPI0021C4C21D|nr:hypothetical protein [Dactylosporangium matsuzakiense]UWZ40928.1 hypothetical protein Dmats_24680 [Dactylosporangium matsuzakiense]